MHAHVKTFHKIKCNALQCLHNQNSVASESDMSPGAIAGIAAGVVCAVLVVVVVIVFIVWRSKLSPKVHSKRRNKDHELGTQEEEGTTGQSNPSVKLTRKNSRQCWS